MFRIVVISLFVANVFLVGLQVGKPPRKTEVVSKSVVAAGDIDIPTIHLFSEIMLRKLGQWLSHRREL